MEDTLQFISIWCDNDTLKMFSHTSFWHLISSSASNSHWWYLRTQTLFNQAIIEFSPLSNWKSVYYTLLFVLTDLPRDVIRESTSNDPYLKLCQAPILRLDIAAVKIVLSIYDPSIYGHTVLYLACCRGWTDIVKLLLSDTRINPNNCITDGCNCLDVACVRDYVPVVQLLLSDDRFALDSSELSPYYLTMNKRTESMELVVSHCNRL